MKTTIITLIICFNFTVLFADDSIGKMLPKNAKIGTAVKRNDSAETKLKVFPKNSIGVPIAKVDTSNWGVIKYSVKELYNNNPFLAWGLSAMLFFSLIKGLSKLFKK